MKFFLIKYFSQPALPNTSTVKK